MTPPTFHVFYPGEGKDGYYLRYDQEATIPDIVDAILHDPIKPKMECPGVVLNKFKETITKFGPTIHNRYEDLVNTTGYFALDVDNAGTKTELVRRVLFDLEEIIVSWISSSNTGVKAIGYSPKLLNLKPRVFSMHYRVLCGNLRMRSHMKLNFDQAMARCHQPVFINSDPNALYKTISYLR
jgi:hypothetical protein